MTRELGSYNTSGTRTHVRFQFSTHAQAGGNVAPLSAFEAADIRIYRAADSAAYSNVQRSSANGVTVTSPFDTLVGLHDVDIDLTDDTDSGFYAAGYRYSVALAPDTETVDGQTITGVPLAEFEIGPPPANVTQVAGSAPAATNAKNFWSGVISYTGTAVSCGPFSNTVELASDAKAVNEYYTNATISIYDGTGQGQTRQVTAYDAATFMITVDTDWGEVPDSTSKVQILGRIV